MFIDIWACCSHLNENDNESESFSKIVQRFIIG